MTLRHRLKPIHTRVCGRARFKVAGLRQSIGLKSRLESQLNSLKIVQTVRASSLTGNMLVTFDTSVRWQQVAAKIESLLAAQADSPSDGSAPTTFQPFQSPPAWHLSAPDDVVESFDTSATRGLAQRVAQQRLAQTGPNALKLSTGRSRLRIFGAQLNSLPLMLLAAEAVVAITGGAFIEAALLAAVIGANAGVGFLVDRRAEQAIIAFKKKPRPVAQVIRDGTQVSESGESLVPGDLLVLKPGTFIGADSRIIQAENLKIDESMLTGESIPVEKTVGEMRDGSAPVADRRNMAYMGTLVVGGRGLAVVIATGIHTEYGQLQLLLEETIPPQTPLIRRLHAMTAQIFRFGLIAGSGILLLGMLRGRSPWQALWSAISITAACVPAGLPSAATLNMTIGIRKLKSEKVVIQRLYALESLGTVQLVCFDKTGTLTRSRISALKLFAGQQAVSIKSKRFQTAAGPINPLEYRDLEQLLRAAVLCNESKVNVDAKTGKQQLAGSPTEIALLYMGILAGIDVRAMYVDHPLQSVQHRSETQRFMTTVHADRGRKWLVFVKGDPYQLLEKCSHQLRGGRRVGLSLKARNQIERQNEQMAAEALRVLGFAMLTVAAETESLPKQDLVWLGLVGMAEPIRKGVGDMIEKLHQGGIETAMITGDQSITATAVATKIGLTPRKDPKFIDSSRFDTMPPELLEALIRDTRIFCRVNPAQKLQIVRGFQAAGRVVAMTGDGINDGPALRAADIGIAMGLSGTDVAREVADVVLEKDNIASMSHAIREGRVAFRNLKRSVRFFVTANASDALLAVAAVTTRQGSALWRLRPVQTNILTDLAPGLALLMEPSNQRIESESPRSRLAPFFTLRESMGILGEAAVISAGSAMAGVYGMARYGLGPRTATLVFETLSAARVLHAFTCRPMASRRSGDRRGHSNRFLLMSLLSALGAQIAIQLIPGLRRLLGVASLANLDLGVIGSLAVATQKVNQALRERRSPEAKSHV